MALRVMARSLVHVQITMALLLAACGTHGLRAAQGTRPGAAGLAGVQGDPQPPELIWSVSEERAEYLPPAVGPDGTVYTTLLKGQSLPPEEGFVVALSPDGVEKWRFPVINLASPVVGPEGTVYIPDLGAARRGPSQEGCPRDGGDVYALRPDGSVKWMVAGVVHPSAELVVGRDRVFAISDRCVNALDLDGNVRWSVDVGPFQKVAAAPDGGAYIGSSRGFEDVLQAFDADGKLRWSLPIAGFVKLPAVGPDGTIYVTYTTQTRESPTPSPTPGEHRLDAITPAGTLRWRRSVGPDPTEPSVGPDGTVFVGSGTILGPGTLTASTADGQLRWSATLPGSPGRRLLVDADGVVYAGGSAISPGGELLWSLGLDLDTAALGRNGRLYLSGGHALLAFAPGAPRPISLGSWSLTNFPPGERRVAALHLMPDGRVLALMPDPSLRDPETMHAALYDPVSETWEDAGRAAVLTRANVVALLPDGRALVAGSSGSFGASVAVAEVFHPQTGMWTPTGPRGGDFDVAAAMGLDGRLRIAALHQDQLGVHAYDPDSDSWSIIASLPVDVRHAVWLADGRLLVTGAGSREPGGILDVDSGAWVPLRRGPLLEDGADHLLLLLDGRVLFLSGLATRVYDPVTETWSTPRPMAQGRSDYTATLLADGRILVVGGNDVFGRELPSAEIYDPMADEWAHTAPMQTARAHHKAVALADGSALVLGSRERDAELFEPAGEAVP